MDWNIIFSGINEGLNLIINFMSIFGIGGIALVFYNEMQQIYEHRSEALFGYYSRMMILLMSIQRNLGIKNNTPLLNGLDAKELIKCQDSYKIDTTLFDSLNSDVKELFNFFKSENWQIPLSAEFSEQIQCLICNMYVVLDVYSYKKYNELDDVVKDHKKISDNIELVIQSIKQEQGKLIDSIFVTKKGSFFKKMKAFLFR